MNMLYVIIGFLLITNIIFFGKGLHNNPPLSPDKFLIKTINHYKNIKEKWKQ